MILLILSADIQSQISLTDSTAFQKALRNSIEVYHQAVSPPAALFNGPRYAHYALRFREGHPYFFSQDKATGYIVAGHIRYENVNFSYDMVRQKIIVYNPAGDPVIVHDKIVKEFSQHGYIFIRIEEDTTGLKEGWYALLHNGENQVIQRREKVMRSEVVQEGEFFYVKEKIQTYIRKDSTYFPVSKRKSILNLFHDKQQELRKYISREKLSFKKKLFESSLLKLIRYYETIN